MASVHTSPDTAAGGQMDRHRLGVGLFLASAFLSFVLSVTLWFTSNHQEGLFVGLWVPSILAAGTFWVSTVARPS